MSSKNNYLTYGAIGFCIVMIFLEPMLLSHVNEYDFAFYIVMAIALYLSHIIEIERNTESE